MHGGLVHAAFNVYWLLVFGTVLERRFGSYRMLALIVLLGYVSMMPQYILTGFSRHAPLMSFLPEGLADRIARDEPVMIVGLSGIVYGLFGMFWIGRRWHSLLLRLGKHHHTPGRSR